MSDAPRWRGPRGDTCVLSSWKESRGPNPGRSHFVLRSLWASFVALALSKGLDGGWQPFPNGEPLLVTQPLPWAFQPP